MNPIREMALRYLNYQDRTAKEVETHLNGKGFGKEDIAEVLAYLKENRLIDDEDYCRRYIQAGIHRGKGPLRLEKELLDRGIRSELVRLGLEEGYDRDLERETALRLVEKSRRQKDTFQESDGEQYERESGWDKEAIKKEEARLARRLASQGFRTSVILEAIAKQAVDKDS